MERNKPFKAYIVDTEEVMTVYYDGPTGHDMVDIYIYRRIWQPLSQVL